MSELHRECKCHQDVPPDLPSTSARALAASSPAAVAVSKLTQEEQQQQWQLQWDKCIHVSIIHVRLASAPNLHQPLKREPKGNTQCTSHYTPLPKSLNPFAIMCICDLPSAPAHCCQVGQVPQLQSAHVRCQGAPAAQCPQCGLHQRRSGPLVHQLAVR
jgi:hypothetical protein